VHARVSTCGEDLAFQLETNDAHNIPIIIPGLIREPRIGRNADVLLALQSKNLDAAFNEFWQSYNKYNLKFGFHLFRVAALTLDMSNDTMLMQGR